jgi:2'-5' RNA ligase
MRLFIAIDINEDVRKAIANLQQQLKDKMKNGNGLKWVAPENMHLTLKFLGETEENKIDEIIAAIEIACADKKTFDFSLSSLGTFGRPAKVLWLGCEKPNSGLVKLAGDLDISLNELGLEKEDRPFSAHLTLGRIKDSGVDKNLRQLLKNWPPPQIPQITADSVCLYKSQLTQDGPVYTLLKKIELKKDI